MDLYLLHFQQVFESDNDFTALFINYFTNNRNNLDALFRSNHFCTKWFLTYLNTLIPVMMANVKNNKNYSHNEHLSNVI